jgi:ATP-dependent RNA helicase DHR2
MDVRKQLSEILTRSSKNATREAAVSGSSGLAADLHFRILQAFLSGFLANTALLMPDGTYKTLMGKQPVAIHPSSVLFGRKVEAIMYNEFVFTQKAYAREVSAVQMNWIGEAMRGVDGTR